MWRCSERVIRFRSTAFKIVFGLFVGSCSKMSLTSVKYFGGGSNNVVEQRRLNSNAPGVDLCLDLCKPQLRVVRPKWWQF